MAEAKQTYRVVVGVHIHVVGGNVVKVKQGETFEQFPSKVSRLRGKVELVGKAEAKKAKKKAGKKSKRTKKAAASSDDVELGIDAGKGDDDSKDGEALAVATGGGWYDLPDGSRVKGIKNVPNELRP